MSEGEIKMLQTAREFFKGSDHFSWQTDTFFVIHRGSQLTEVIIFLDRHSLSFTEGPTDSLDVKIITFSCFFFNQ